MTPTATATTATAGDGERWRAIPPAFHPAAAAFLRLREGLARRRPFDSLVGAFCLFVAGE